MLVFGRLRLRVVGIGDPAFGFDVCIGVSVALVVGIDVGAVGLFFDIVCVGFCVGVVSTVGVGIGVVGTGVCGCCR